MGSNRKMGEIGEKAARDYLERLGYRIIDTNFRTRIGEIDLVAYDGNILAFIEVKTRSSSRYGTPGEAIDWKKQRKLNKLALLYLSKNRVLYSQIRFDAVEVIVRDEQVRRIHLIKDAFQTVRYI